MLQLGAMCGWQVSSDAFYGATQHGNAHRNDQRQHSAVGFSLERSQPMSFSLPRVLRNIMGLSTPHDEHLLAGADEESLQELGVSQPVLSQFQQDVAVQCPDLVHEAQMSFARKN